MSPEQRPGRVLTRLVVRSCAYCQASFESRREDHRFCSAKCRSLGFHAEREHKRQQAQRDRDAKARLFLRTASQSIEEARQLLAELPPSPTSPQGDDHADEHGDGR